MFSTSLTLSCPGSWGTSSVPREVGRAHRRARCRPGAHGIQAQPRRCLASASAGQLAAPLLDPETLPSQLPRPRPGPGNAARRRRLPARPWHHIIWKGASVLTFKCHNAILRIMLVSKEASSDLVPAPRALSLGKGTEWSRHQLASTCTLVKW